MIHQILVVEDDDGIALPLVRTLEREGYLVERMSQGLPAVERIRAGGIHLVILDLGLPDVDGLEVCRQMREDGFCGGILVLTARGGELDRVVGLDVGADDYMAKPFGLAELLARTRALLRRFRTDGEARAGSRLPDMEVNLQSRRARVAGRELPLTAKEFDVLALLHTEPGAVITRERLMDTVWDENWYGSTKTLDVTIGRLRQKLEDHGAPARVTTVRGIGFRLEPVQSDA
jgi:DNA-binding response OmpR family regulator